MLFKKFCLKCLFIQMYNILYFRHSWIYSYIAAFHSIECPAEVKDFSSEMLAEELVKLNEKLGIPVSLKEVGVKEELFEAMAIDAMNIGRIILPP